MKLVAFVKRDCPTCVLVVPALAQLAARELRLRVDARQGAHLLRIGAVGG